MSASLPVDLSRVDAGSAWEAWKPDERDPWNARSAAHLLRRAAFGASPDRIAQAVRAGVEPTIAELLTGKSDHNETDSLLSEMGARFATEGELEKLRGWWLYAMLNSGHPLREKMTLFWHNHFATSIGKVKSVELMYRQNALLRKHALGEFRPFLHDMGRDAAMLIWLDSTQNVKGKPNENYAREVMELFSLGVGNYTEKDIREAARAFTGRHIDENFAFDFVKEQHDEGTKTLLGQTGKFNGDEIVPILLDQPACARFLVGKLYREFISEIDPPAALIEPLAKRFRESGYKIADLLGVMLRSRMFFSQHAFLQRIKSPVEFVLGAVQSAWKGPARPVALVDSLAKMGQNLFAPPNVKGWPGGRTWLNTTTLLARNNFADQVAMGNGAFAIHYLERPPLFPEVPPPITEPKPMKHVPTDPAAEFDITKQLKKIDSTKPIDMADELLNLFLPGGFSAGTRKKITAYLLEDAPVGIELRERIREAAHAVLCSAEYQQC